MSTTTAPVGNLSFNYFNVDDQGQVKAKGNILGLSAAEVREIQMGYDARNLIAAFNAQWNPNASNDPKKAQTTEPVSTEKPAETDAEKKAEEKGFFATLINLPCALISAITSVVFAVLNVITCGIFSGQKADDAQDPNKNTEDPTKKTGEPVPVQ